MKKTILMIATAAAAALSLSFATGNKVSAATSQDKKATVNLTVGKDADGNDKTIDLTQAPNFKFTDVTIDATKGNTSTATGDAPLTVDNPGIAATWDVTGKLGAFVSDSDKNVSLKGASVAFVGSDAGKAANPAEAKSLSLDANGASGSFYASSKIVASDTESGYYTGVGTNEDNITATLTVPAGNVQGSYTAAMNWTLTQDPANTPATPTSNN